MEKGAGTGGGFDVSDKKSSSNSDFVASLVKLQDCIHHGYHHQGSNLGHPLVGDDADADGGGGVGHTDSHGGTNEVVVGNIYRDDGGGRNFGRTNLQPFDVFPSHYSSTTICFKSSGMGFPFTDSQLKELERQAMIYDLLFPLSRKFPATAPFDSVSSMYSNGRRSKTGDPEPGRCKRTDGKKWRCSRDVAPNQKYCEHHLNRGRPRSRKPVEAKKYAAENHKKTRLEQSNAFPPVQSICSASRANDLSFSLYYNGTNRDLGRIAFEQPWATLMEAGMGLTNCHFPQDYVLQQPLNVFPYPDFSAAEIELPSGFIDAWSTDNPNSRNTANNIQPSTSLNDGDLSTSLSLSTAMAVGNIADHEMRRIQTGFNVKDWEPFARGGPLGEALQPVSPYESISTPATAVSSPSGVLHWTLFSHPDSSVCNSPTFVAAPP